MSRLAAAILAVALLTTPAAAQNVGQWTSMPPLPFFPTAMHLLPTGKVMFFGGDAQGNPPGSPATTVMAWDPASGQSSNLAPPGYDLFCAGHSYLADGRLLLTGGHILNFVGLANTSAYDAFADRWTAYPNMNAGRWYPTNTTLANGDVLVTSGQIDTNQGIDALPQVFSAASGTWRDLTNAQLVLDLYPRMHLAPNGLVFNSGPSGTTRYLDTSGTGSWTFVANRDAGNRDYGSAVMYDTGKILFVGGGDPPTAQAEVIDLTASPPAWRKVGSMAFPRRHLNATLLPDGKVLVTGGTSGSGFNDTSSPVYPAELWDPATERWTTLASQSVGRFYHSVALLLPDGRVMSAGGNGHPEVEVFSPPYMFAGPRPTITAAPASVGYGQSFSVQTPDAAGITAVTWIRLPSVTHAFDQNQRINRLTFTRGSGTLSVTAPNNANVTPPGHYMLFILNSQGVPSVARIVQIGGGAAPPPPNPPTLSSMSPTSVAAGSGAFTLTVNGTNFVAGSTVQWNGAARATTFVSATQLTASIGASDVAAAGSATVTVINPSGGGTSNGLTFTISGGGLQVWITQPTPGATVSGTAWATVWLDGTSGASNALNATLDGRAAGSTTSSSAGPISFTFDTTVVSDGTHTLTVAARDAVGHTGTNGISIQTNNGISAPPPPPPPPPPGWTFCANENQTCTFSGTKLVRYGANGTYVQQTATNSIGCNNATFGDPLPGVVKHCDYTDAPSTSTWTFCANEDQTCTFSGTKLVRYGANGTYVQQTATSSISCNNATFGDPLVGVVKHCDYTDAPPTSTWTFCANENQTCTFAGTKIVRYGANGTYVQQTATTSISCNNATFGDPLVGTFKHCDYTDSGSP